MRHNKLMARIIGEQSEVQDTCSAQDNDTGHSILLLEEGGQGEKSQLELLVVKHLDTQILVARNSREKKRQIAIDHCSCTNIAAGETSQTN